MKVPGLARSRFYPTGAFEILSDDETAKHYDSLRLLKYSLARHEAELFARPDAVITFKLVKLYNSQGKPNDKDAYICIDGLWSNDEIRAVHDVVSRPSVEAIYSPLKVCYSFRAQSWKNEGGIILIIFEPARSEGQEDAGRGHPDTEETVQAAEVDPAVQTPHLLKSCLHLVRRATVNVGLLFTASADLARRSLHVNLHIEIETGKQYHTWHRRRQLDSNSSMLTECVTSCTLAVSGAYFG